MDTITSRLLGLFFVVKLQQSLTLRLQGFLSVENATKTHQTSKMSKFVVINILISTQFLTSQGSFSYLVSAKYLLCFFIFQFDE